MDDSKLANIIRFSLIFLLVVLLGVLIVGSAMGKMSGANALTLSINIFYLGIGIIALWSYSDNQLFIITEFIIGLLCLFGVPAFLILGALGLGKTFWTPLLCFMSAILGTRIIQDSYWKFRDQKNPLLGFGGWLYFILFGLLIQCVLGLLSLIYFRALADFLYTNLSAMALFVLLGPVVLALIAGYSIYLAFSKKHHFPYVAILSMSLGLIHLLVSLFSLDAFIDFQNMFLFVSLITLLGIGYLVLSKRVQNTYIASD